MNLRKSDLRKRSSDRSRNNARRVMTVETLDARAMLAGDFSIGESMMRLDVNRDSAVTSNDALRVINEIDRSGVREIVGNRDAEVFDSNRDGWISASDALVVVNHVGRHGNAEIRLRDLLGERRQLVSEEQRDNFRQLFSDLNAIRRESDVTPAQIMGLLNNIATAVEDATLPSEESVAQLLDSVRTAADDGAFSAEEVEQITTDLQAVLESANISEEDAQAVAEDLRAIFDASGVDRDDVAVILDDLRAIVTEFQNRDPLVSEEQRENVRQLLEDLAGIAAGSDVTLDQLQQLRSNIRAALEDATRPDFFLVMGLARDAREAFADGELSQEERAELADGLDAVLESANVSQEDRDTILSDIESIIDDSGITIDDLQTIAQDLMRIRAESGFNQRGGPLRGLISRIAAQR